MSESFCVLPWIHLATHPNGGVSLCCRSNHTNAISWAKKSSSQDLLTLNSDSIQDIMNSEKFVEVRRKMLNGQRPIECEGCWRDEDSGIKSKRIYENERWAHVIEKMDKNEVLDNVDLIYIELRLGNICNNACLTCNSYSSSKWYPDEQKLSKALSWFNLRPSENYKWFEKESFYHDLALKSAGVEEIYINGGEPTLIKEHFKYLNKLIEIQVAQNVHLVYSLNMMDIPDKLIDLWKLFKKVTVNASIDDFGQRNYYIRYPTKWNETINSINKLNSVDNIEWHVTQTVSIFNVHNLEELSNWLKNSYNKVPYHNYVLYPDYLSLAVLPNWYKEQILTSIKKMPAHQLNELAAKLSINYQENLLIKSREFILAMDNIRELNYKEFIPELSKII